MKRDLVVFYSRTGYTRQLAELLARALDADLDEIREPRPRSGVAGYVRSAWEALEQVEPPLLDPVYPPYNYARVVVGSPVWAGHVSSPVRAYLCRHRDALRHVAFFCTYGGRGAAQVLDEMARLVDRTPKPSLALTDRELFDHRDDRLAPFVKELLGVRA